VKVRSAESQAFGGRDSVASFALECVDDHARPQSIDGTFHCSLIGMINVGKYLQHFFWKKLNSQI
jgi:hypothetical protein